MGFFRCLMNRAILHGSASTSHVFGNVRHAVLPSSGPAPGHRDQDFDTWAATFGQVVEEMELFVAGQ